MRVPPWHSAELLGVTLRRKEELMRRLVLVLTAMGVAVFLASGVALAQIASTSPSVDENGTTSTMVPDVYRGAVEVTAGGWIVFTKAQEDYALKNSTTFIKQGERTPDGGCLFSGELVLPPGTEAVEVRQTASNPQTCQARLERGRPPLDTLDAAPDSSQATTQSTTESDETIVSNDAEEPTVEPSDLAVDDRMDRTRHRSAGFHTSRYEDPLNIVVNRVKNDTNWWWNGNVVQAPVYNGYYLTWLSGSGWTREAHDWNHRATTYQTTSSSYAHFRNALFCDAVTDPAAPPTHTYYDRNRVHGQYDGDLIGAWNSWDSGGCDEFLTFHHRLVRTHN
jgi:hypothetical protein